MSALPVIEVDRLTKDYGEGRGVFDVSFSVAAGECYGFLGPNGAGKTTTIRHLMGFSRPDTGAVRLQGLDCWTNAARLMQSVGYLPGEVCLPRSMSARTFLAWQIRLRGIGGANRAKELMDRFQLDSSLPISRMGIGQRRKLAVVAAFLHDPAVLVLDEPTSGLDPLMQDAFIEFVLEEKRRGKTILLSSHLFNEVAATADSISIVKQGHLVDEFAVAELDGAARAGQRAKADRHATAKGLAAEGTPAPTPAASQGGAPARYRGSVLSAVLRDPPQRRDEPSAAAVASSAAGARAAEPAEIAVCGLTKDYGSARGVFDASFSVRRGEVFGLVGTNGSGKTTTIRALMGFIRPTAGAVRVRGKDAWSCAPELKSLMAYVPGEIQFPSFARARSFFRYQAELLGMRDLGRCDELVERLRLDDAVNPRKMSKGMKQKTALVAALMAEREILLMDEPTTGLDPVMREAFLGLIEEEKQSGHTVFMSSHVFEEIEEVCDRVAVLDAGKVVAVMTVAKLEEYRSMGDDARRRALEERFADAFGSTEERAVSHGSAR